MGDMLWISRYLLLRIAEDFNVSVSFEPKLFDGWNGAGCHTNYSTKTMRDGSEGLEYIYKMMDRFERKHDEHIEVYGDNTKRLTGTCETSRRDKFSYGPGNRAASIRIPTETMANKKGYIEDRRPASDIDPYVVCAMIVDSSILEESQSKELLEFYRKWVTWRKENKL